MKLKKYSCSLMLLLLLLFSVFKPINAEEVNSMDLVKAEGHQISAGYKPKGSIITEINTGQILWEEGAENILPPASMSKLMTLLLVYEAMEKGAFTEETEVSVGEKHLDISGRYALSNNKMKAGVTYTVGELIDLIIVPSSAAATYMLTDLIEENPELLAKKLNDKAQSLGMKETKYYNPIGVMNQFLTPYHSPKQSLTNDNMTSPRDYALLCSYFIKKYPQILNHTRGTQLTIKKGTAFEESFDTYQLSLEGAKYGLEGTDGIKTGSALKGFNYSSTARRGDTRLIEIVMGVGSWEDQKGEEIRHIIGNALMENTFKNFEYRMILPKGKHEINSQKVVLEGDLWDCVPKGEEVPLALKNSKVSVDLERSYLPGYEVPSVPYKMASTIDFFALDSLFLPVLLFFITILLILILIMYRRIRYIREMEAIASRGRRHRARHK